MAEAVQDTAARQQADDAEPLRGGEGSEHLGTAVGLERVTFLGHWRGPCGRWRVRSLSARCAGRPTCRRREFSRADGRLPG